jgi:hypothetical protein
VTRLTPEFDRVSQIWVERRYGIIPDLGSVKFAIDGGIHTSYDTGGWCDFKVSWTNGALLTTKEIEKEAWDYDATALMRDLFRIAAELTLPASGHETEVAP